MTQSELVLVILAVVGTLVVMGGMAAGLVAMAVWLSRRTAKMEAEVVTQWNALARSLELAVEPRGRHPPILSGTYRGRPLRLTGRYGNDNNPGYTNARVSADFAADVYLRKSQGRNPLMEYQPSGDADLDKRFVFQSRPPGLLARAVADPNLRRALAATDAWLNLDPRGASSGVTDVLADPGQLRALIEQAAEAADFVQREIGLSVPLGRPASPEAYADPFTPSLRIRLPRWALFAVLAVGLLVLAACLCAALWPAAAEVLKALQGA